MMQHIEINEDLTEELADELMLISLKGKGSYFTAEMRKECEEHAREHLQNASLRELWGGAVVLLIGLFEVEDLRSRMNLPKEP